MAEQSEASKVILAENDIKKGRMGKVILVKSSVSYTIYVLVLIIFRGSLLTMRMKRMKRIKEMT